MNGKSFGLWLLTLVLFGIFVSAGFSKLLGAQDMIEEFQRFGYSDTFRVLVGFGEVAAAVALLMPRAAAASAWFLVCVMLGATWTYLTLHEYTAALVPVGVGLLCLTWHSPDDPRHSINRMRFRCVNSTCSGSVSGSSIALEEEGRCFTVQSL